MSRELRDLILTRVKEFSDEQGLTDDITIMVVQV